MSEVYVDELFSWPVRLTKTIQARRVAARNGGRWCHMWSEDLEALHAMARRIGMKREWFQNKQDFPHYDLVPSRRAKALELGAKLATADDMVAFVKVNRAVRQQKEVAV